MIYKIEKMETITLTIGYADENIKFKILMPDTTFFFYRNNKDITLIFGINGIINSTCK